MLVIEDLTFLKMKTKPHKNEDDLTQKIKTTSAKKLRRCYPKKEDDLSQKIRMTSPKNKDNLTPPLNYIQGQCILICGIFKYHIVHNTSFTTCHNPSQSKAKLKLGVAL